MYFFYLNKESLNLSKLRTHYDFKHLPSQQKISKIFKLKRFFQLFHNENISTKT